MVYGSRRCLMSVWFLLPFQSPVTRKNKNAFIENIIEFYQKSIYKLLPRQKIIILIKHDYLPLQHRLESLILKTYLFMIIVVPDLCIFHFDVSLFLLTQILECQSVNDKLRRIDFLKLDASLYTFSYFSKNILSVLVMDMGSHPRVVREDCLVI